MNTLNKINLDCGKLSKFFNGSNNLVFTLGKEDSKILNIDNNEYKHLFNHNFNENIVYFVDIEISNDNKYLALNYNEGTSSINIRNLHNNKELEFDGSKFIEPEDSFYTIEYQFTKDSNQLLMGSGNYLKLLNLNDSKCEKTLSIMDDEAQCTMAVKLNKENNKVLVYCAVESTVQLIIFDFPSLKIIDKLVLDGFDYTGDIWHSEPFLNADFNLFNDNEILFATPFSNSIQIYNYSNQKLSNTNFSIPNEVDNYIRKYIENFYISSDFSKLFLLYVDKMAIFDFKSEKLLYNEKRLRLGLGSGNFLSTNMESTKLITSSYHWSEEIRNFGLEVFDISTFKYDKLYSIINDNMLFLNEKYQ